MVNGPVTPNSESNSLTACCMVNFGGVESASESRLLKEKQRVENSFTLSGCNCPRRIEAFSKMEMDLILLKGFLKKEKMSNSLTYLPWLPPAFEVLLSLPCSCFFEGLGFRFRASGF